MCPRLFLTDLSFPSVTGPSGHPGDGHLPEAVGVTESQRWPGLPLCGVAAEYALRGYQVQVAPVALLAASSGGSPEATQHAGLSMP